ncbi:MAG TPA: hypothetical protein VFN21_04240, partial [Acidimicrobiales bacterium]|nr:hypothetical protein [Acidimicrobiales bacterium]
GDATRVEPVVKRRIPWKPLASVAALVVVLAVVALAVASGPRDSKDGPVTPREAGGGLVPTLSTVPEVNRPAVTPTDIELTSFTPDAAGNLTGKIAWTPSENGGVQLALQVASSAPGSEARKTIVVDESTEGGVAITLLGGKSPCTGLRMGTSTLSPDFCALGPPCIEATAQKEGASTGDPIAVLFASDSNTGGTNPTNAIDPAAYNRTCSTVFSGGN